MISYGSIPNSKDDNETDDEVQEDIYVNIELGLPRKYDDGLRVVTASDENLISVFTC